MAHTKRSSVDAFMAGRREVPNVGGAGRKGALTNWLLQEAEAIARARAPDNPSPLTWEEIQQLVFNDGVVPGPGRRYSAKQICAKWSQLRRDNKLPLCIGRILKPSPIARREPELDQVRRGNAADERRVDRSGSPRDVNAVAADYAAEFDSRRQRPTNEAEVKFELDTGAAYRPKPQ